MIVNGDPYTYEEAIECQDKERWVQAMSEEMQSPIRMRRSDWMLLSIVATQDLKLEQMDVKTAFLHEHLEKKIYMEQPLGFQESGAEGKRKTAFNRWDYSNPGYLDALKHQTDLKEEGKIKTIALTNFDTERLHIILENGIPVVSNQVQHSVVDMRPQQRMAELCQLTGVKLITYGTVMGGLLSEKFLDTNVSIPFAGPPLNTPSLQKYKRMVDAWGGWSLFQVLLQTLKRVASKHGVSIPTVAVRYILDQQSVAGSMVGVRLGLGEHIQDTNAVFSLALDEEDINEITEVSKKGKDLLEAIGDCGDEYRRA
ncbi:uncharacterized protein [Elaeis guineensis]|uniref:uncharacterized protein n=1 Tax=Elaeis guineensis var. tenera TaxID=51953 RepID=UPI003C6D70D6